MKKNYFRDLLVQDISTSNVIISGIAYDLGCSCGSGASKEFEKMCELSAYLPPFSMDGNDLRNIKLYNNGLLKIDEKDFYNSLFLKAETLFATGKINVFIGGDHSVSISTEKAFLDYCKKVEKIPVIIHIDAHPDICDIYNESKYSHACTNRRSLENGLADENLVLIGIRGYEAQEVEFLHKHPKISVYNASYLNRYGILKMLNELKNKYSDNKHLVYLSYDIDANDPSFAPGTGTPEAFGLNNLDILEIVKFIIANLNVVATDLVEISPSLDINDITTWLGLKTLYEIFNELIEKNKF